MGEKRKSKKVDISKIVHTKSICGIYLTQASSFLLGEECQHFGCTFYDGALCVTIMLAFIEDACKKVAITNEYLMFKFR